MTCCGRLFHTRDAVIGNDRSPTVVRRVRRTTSIDVDAEQGLHRTRESAGRLSCLPTEIYNLCFYSGTWMPSLKFHCLHMYVCMHACMYGMYGCMYVMRQFI